MNRIKRSSALYGLSLLASILIGISSSASASFFDDFEDGNANGWAESASGTGSTGVVDNNGSLRAFANTSYLGQRSLAQTFAYVGSDILSFDMQVNAHTGIELTIGGAITRQASGGLKLSFLNQFNGAVGDPIYLTYRTDGVAPPAYNGVLVGQTLLNYSAPMSDYASLGGLGNNSSIAKVSLEFFANSGGGGGGTGSSAAGATVWFDNVSISAVPLPAALPLLLSGIAGLGMIGRMRKAA